MWPIFGPQRDHPTLHCHCTVRTSYVCVVCRVAQPAGAGQDDSPLPPARQWQAGVWGTTACCRPRPAPCDGPSTQPCMRACAGACVRTHVRYARVHMRACSHAWREGEGHGAPQAPARHVSRKGLGVGQLDKRGGAAVAVAVGRVARHAQLDLGRCLRERVQSHCIQHVTGPPPSICLMHSTNGRVARVSRAAAAAAGWLSWVGC